MRDFRVRRREKTAWAVACSFAGAAQFDGFRQAGARWSRIAVIGSAATLAWGQTDLVELRLQTALASTVAKAGHPFQATVTAPMEVDGRVVLPRGTVVHGVVRRVTRVGMGLVRERASIDVEFVEYELADGRAFTVSGKVEGVDNARENVQADGRIRGILAANQPHSWVQGVWIQPRAMLFPKSLLGLTGVSGKLLTQFSLGPIGAVGLLAARITAFRLPEPEIHFPAGTDLVVRMQGLQADVPTFEPDADAQLPADLSDWVRARGFAVKKSGEQPADDIVNLFFVGSERQLAGAFAAAGWSHSDALSRKSFAKAYKAYTSHSGYAAAPVSKLMLDGEEPVHVFQKSLNTISKRHHVRLWRREFKGEPVWLGAATQDVGIALEPKSLSFTHKIHPAIDRERSKIVNDLAFVGCSRETGYVERAEAAQSGGSKNAITTDGRAAVLFLGACEARTLAAEESHPGRPRSIFKRAARRTVLETRHYLLRGNAYYWGYRALRYRRAKPAETTLILAAKRLERPAGTGSRPSAIGFQHAKTPAGSR